MAVYEFKVLLFVIVLSMSDLSLRTFKGVWSKGQEQQLFVEPLLGREVSQSNGSCTFHRQCCRPGAGDGSEAEGTGKAADEGRKRRHQCVSHELVAVLLFDKHFRSTGWPAVSNSLPPDICTTIDLHHSFRRSLKSNLFGKALNTTPAYSRFYLSF